MAISERQQGEPAVNRAFEPVIETERRVRRVRLSISVPEDVASWARWKADQDGTNVSKVVVDAVTTYARSEQPQSDENPAE